MESNYEKEISGTDYKYQSATGGGFLDHPVWVKSEKKEKPKHQTNNLMPLPPMEEIHKKHKIYA